jgi:hypothetical protein
MHFLEDFSNPIKEKDVGLNSIVLAVKRGCQDAIHLIFHIPQALVYCIQLGLQPTLLSLQIIFLIRKGHLTPTHSKTTSTSEIPPPSSSPCRTAATGS